MFHYPDFLLLLSFLFRVIFCDVYMYSFSIEIADA